MRVTDFIDYGDKDVCRLFEGILSGNRIKRLLFEHEGSITSERFMGVICRGLLNIRDLEEFEIRYDSNVYTAMLLVALRTDNLPKNGGESEFYKVSGVNRQLPLKKVGF